MANNVTPETTDYREKMFHRVSPALDFVGNKFFDLEFSDEQRVYWSEVMRVMFSLDDVLDEDKPKDERFGKYDQMLDVITTGKPNETLPQDANDLLIQFHETTVSLDPSRLETARKNAHVIALLGERIRETKSPQILAATVLAEGRLTARIVAAAPNGTLNGDPTKFNHYLETGTSAANGLDTVLDLKKDSKEGILDLNPNLRNRIELFGRVLPTIRQAFKPLDARMSLSMLADIPFIIAANRKSKNRS